MIEIIRVMAKFGKLAPSRQKGGPEAHADIDKLEQNEY